MIVAYNEFYDTMRIGEINEKGECVIHLWFSYSTKWTTLPERSITGIRILANLCDDIILHDDGEI